MSAPALSVVVPSVTGWESLAECLVALRNQADLAGVEVVVIDRLGEGLRAQVAETFPQVHVIAVPPRTPIPEMRAVGIRAATGGVVGVIEDHVIVPPDWGARMLEAHADGALVVGGAIENAAVERLSDQAAFLCEYHHCLSPGPAGPATWLPGNNVTYARSVLARYDDVLARGQWENVLHDHLREAGITLERRPDIRVGHKLHIGYGAYLQQRFLYSRSFAAMRLSSAGAPRRLAYGLAALLLPPVLFSRIWRAVWREGRHRAVLLKSTPWLALFVVGWAVGETAGAWFGAGTALARVR